MPRATMASEAARIDSMSCQEGVCLDVMFTASPSDARPRSGQPAPSPKQGRRPLAKRYHAPAPPPKALSRRIAITRRNSRSAIHDIGQLLAADAKPSRSLGDAQAQRFQAVESDGQSGMRRALHGHVGHPSSVIVNEIDIRRIPVFKPEHDSQLRDTRTDQYPPDPFQRMEADPGKSMLVGPVAMSRRARMRLSLST